MARITDIIAEPGFPADKKEIKKIADKYPWFFTARAVIEAGSDSYSPAMALHLTLHPTPLPMLREVSTSDFAVRRDTEAGNERQQDGYDIIEKFLRHGEYRITPGEDASELDAASESSVLTIPDELATEELADIYMKQGLKEQAEAIYRKLGKK